MRLAHQQPMGQQIIFVQQPQQQNEANASSSVPTSSSTGDTDHQPPRKRSKVAADSSTGGTATTVASGRGGGDDNYVIFNPSTPSSSSTSTLIAPHLMDTAEASGTLPAPATSTIVLQALSPSRSRQIQGERASTATGESEEEERETTAEAETEMEKRERMLAEEEAKLADYEKLVEQSEQMAEEARRVKLQERERKIQKKKQELRRRLKEAVDVIERVKTEDVPAADTASDAGGTQPSVVAGDMSVDSSSCPVAVAADGHETRRQQRQGRTEGHQETLEEIPEGAVVFRVEEGGEARAVGEGEIILHVDVDGKGLQEQQQRPQQTDQQDSHQDLAQVGQQPLPEPHHQSATNDPPAAGASSAEMILSFAGPTEVDAAAATATVQDESIGIDENEGDGEFVVRSFILSPLTAPTHFFIVLSSFPDFRPGGGILARDRAGNQEGQGSLLETAAAVAVTRTRRTWARLRRCQSPSTAVVPKGRRRRMMMAI